MNNTNIKIGEIKTIAGEKFIVLDILKNGVLCLLKDFAYEDTMFDNNTNNYTNSSIRKTLNTEYLKKISDVIGEENIVEFEIDLTSDDGLDDYGKVSDKVGLLTADMYRKYNRIIEKYPVNDWWWLSTPWSTPHRGYSFTVRCVSCNGTLLINDFNNCFGVRPFCILKSNIFVSK